MLNIILFNIVGLLCILGLFLIYIWLYHTNSGRQFIKFIIEVLDSF